MTFELSNSTGYLVNRVAALMKTALERELLPYGVTAQQWALTATAGAEAGAGVAAIAEKLGIDVGATSRLIDRLEEKGLLERIRTEHDARQASVTLTAAGRALLPKLVRCAERVLERYLAPLSDREVATLNALLKRLASPLPLAPAKTLRSKALKPGGGRDRSR